MAATGVSSFAATGDGNTATARQAQAPLGLVSATPPAGSITPSDTPGTSNPGDVPNTGDAGDVGSGTGSSPDQTGNPGAGATLPSADHGTTPVANTSASGGGSQGASLPFTGFLAIPVLLLGVAMLATGLAARRRTASPFAV